MPPKLSNSTQESLTRTKFPLFRIALCALFLTACAPKQIRRINNPDGSYVPTNSNDDQNTLVIEDEEVKESKYKKIRRINEPYSPPMVKPATDQILESEAVPEPIEPEPEPKPLPRLEDFDINDVCFVGDSYMVGISHQNVKEFPYAKNGRPMVSNSEKWEGNDVLTKAKEAIASGNCKLLVLNGGLNDLNAYYGDLDATLKRIEDAYEEILALIDEDTHVMIFTVPKIPKLPLEEEAPIKRRLKVKAKIDEYTDRLNEELAKYEGITLIDTEAIINGRFVKDGVHPWGRAYKTLYEAL